MTSHARDKRTRVLHIVQNLNYGGMERLLFEMLRHSDRSRFDNHVLNLQFIGRFGEGMTDFAGVSVARPMNRLSLLYPVSLAEDIRRLQPDVVHTHSGVWYKASLAARIAGVKRLVHTEHGRAVPDPFVSRTLDGMAASRTDAIVAVSETVGALLRNNVTKKWDAIHVIPNGVDVGAFSRVADDGVLRSQLGIAAGVPIIGSIGRLEAIKGYEVMVDAYAAFRKQWVGSDIPALVIAGDGAQRGALQARAAALGITDGLHWLGWRDDIHTMHAAFTIFTMSSHSEGTSVSLLEAMSAEICPVVTDVGGNSAVLGPALQHRLVPRGDANALAAQWIELLEDNVLRAHDAIAARARIEQCFTLDAMVRAYQNLYVNEARV